jgi:sigma-B regulation protein RsbU (phosphoserine phosphatase)
MFATDGILEALNDEGVEFGSLRLAEVVQSARDQSARAIVDTIFDAVNAFRGGQPQADDMTAVAVKITV